MNPNPSPSSRRKPGSLTNAAHAPRWAAFAAEFAAFRAAYPAQKGDDHGLRGLLGLASAMGYGKSVSTLRNALTGASKRRGTIVPGIDKIEAGEKWLEKNKQRKL